MDGPRDIGALAAQNAFGAEMLQIDFNKSDDDMM